MTWTATRANDMSVANFLASPVGSFVTGTGAPVIKAAVGFAWGASFGSGVGRLAEQMANRRVPNVLPPVDALINAYMGGWLPTQAFNNLMLCHGIPSDPSMFPGGNLGMAWRDVLASIRPKLSPEYTRNLHFMGLLEQADIKLALNHLGISENKLVDAVTTEWHKLSPEAIMQLWTSGRINVQTMRTLMTHHGFREVDIRRLMNLYRLYPNVSDAAGIYRAGNCDLVQLRDWLRRAGYRDDAITPIADSLTMPLSVPMAIEARNRGRINDIQFRRYLERNGVRDEDDIRRLEYISRGIPTYSDMQLMIRREAFDTAIVRRFGYDDEYRREYETLLEATGVVGTPFDTIQGLPDEFNIPWAKAMYRTRWHLPSPTQAYTMLHRLRGNPADPRTWRVPGVAPFTGDDLSELLRVNDYPLFFRRKLEAISYKLPRLIDVRAMQEFQIENRQEVTARYEDMGYTADDADKIYRLNRQRIRDKRRRYLKNKFNASMGRMIDNVLQQYRNDIVDDTELTDNLESVGYTRTEAETMTRNVKIEERVKLQNGFLKQLYSDWLAGDIDNVQAEQRLKDAGWTDYSASNVVYKFGLKRTSQRRYLKTRETIEYAKQGYMDRDELLRRLGNMGWSEADLLLHMAGYDDAIATNLAIEKAADKRRSISQSMDTIKKIKSTLAFIEKERAASRRAWPIEALKLAYANNEMSDTTFIDIMTTQGYSDDAIQQRLIEAETDRMNLNGACNDDAPEDYENGKATEEQQGTAREGESPKSTTNA